MLKYPAGRVLTSDLSANSFIMIVYEHFCYVHSEFSVQSMTKDVPITVIIKLFTDKSEISALPAGCQRDTFGIWGK